MSPGERGPAASWPRLPSRVRVHVGKRAPPPFQGPRLNRRRRAAAERRRRPAPRGSLTRGPEDAELRAERFRVADVRFCTLPARLAALGFISRLLLKLGADSAPAWWRVGRRRLIEARESSQSAPWVIDLKAPRQRQTPGPVLALPQGDGRSGAEGRAVSCDQQGRPGSSCVPRPPPWGCGARASHLAPRPRGPVAGSGERDGRAVRGGGPSCSGRFPGLPQLGMVTGRGAMLWESESRTPGKRGSPTGPGKVPESPSAQLFLVTRTE